MFHKKDPEEQGEKLWVDEFLPDDVFNETHHYNKPDKYVRIRLLSSIAADYKKIIVNYKAEVARGLGLEHNQHSDEKNTDNVQGNDCSKMPYRNSKDININVFEEAPVDDYAPPLAMDSELSGDKKSGKKKGWFGGLGKTVGKIGNLFKSPKGSTVKKDEIVIGQDVDKAEINIEKVEGKNEDYVAEGQLCDKHEAADESGDEEDIVEYAKEFSMQFSVKNSKGSDEEKNHEGVIFEAKNKFFKKQLSKIEHTEINKKSNRSVMFPA